MMKDVEKSLLTTKNDLLQEKINVKIILERQKNPLDKKAKKRYNNFKFFVLFAAVSYYTLLVMAIFYFSWNIVEQYTFTLSIFPIISSFLYLWITEQTFDPLNYLKTQKKKYYTQTYEEFNFDIIKLEENVGMIAKLTKEIKELKKSSS